MVKGCNARQKSVGVCYEGTRYAEPTAALVLGCIQMIDRGIALLIFPVGLQPTDLDPWGRPGPICAMGTGLRQCGGFLMSALARRSLLNRVNGSEH
jgi:hypothetical protein